MITLHQIKKLNVGLHAQTLDHKDGLVAGSEVTTLALKKAFERRSDVKRVNRYGPGNYNSLDVDDLDLMIIEGWDKTLPKFIRRGRKHHPRIKIYFWNLSLFGISEVLKLDVDGYFTNSQKAVPVLERIAPTRFVMLAADPDEFKPVKIEEKYSHNVTYLGIFHHHKSSDIIERILCEARDYGLVIYGKGWDQYPILKKYWRGALPFGDIAKLYSSVKIVLGMTEARQKVAGMINNRVFEALSSGACFISEYYPKLEEVFGDTILYSHKMGDTYKHIERLLKDVSYNRGLGVRGRELILKHHTYDHRVEEMINLHYSVCGSCD